MKHTGDPWTSTALSKEKQIDVSTFLRDFVFPLKKTSLYQGTGAPTPSPPGADVPPPGLGLPGLCEDRDPQPRGAARGPRRPDPCRVASDEPWETDCALVLGRFGGLGSILRAESLEELLRIRATVGFGISNILQSREGLLLGFLLTHASYRHTHTHTVAD